jgi:hypothetical protein
MKTDITDRMKKNGEIGRIAMLQLRCGMEISDKTARLVAMTVENPDVGHDTIARDDSRDALQAVWVLDDAENMASGFADLEGRLAKLRTLLAKEGYTMVRTEEPGQPFILVPEKKEAASYSLYVSFGRKKQLEAQFGVKKAAEPEGEYQAKQLEEKIKELQGVLKLLKKLNGLNIRGEEKKLQLALFSSEERYTVRQARAKRLEQAKQRGSI